MHLRLVLSSAIVALALALAPAVASAAPPNADASPSPAATSPAPNAPSGANAGDLRALELRLDALTQQNAAQETELAQVRAQIARLRGGNAPNGTAAAPAAGPASQGAAQPAAPVVGEAQPLRAAPKGRAVEAIYQQQNAAFLRKLTITPSFTTAYSDNRFFTLNGFLALNAIFLGNVNVTQQRNDIKIAQLDATYGLGPRFQVEASVPYYVRSATFSSVGANFAGQVPSQDSTHSSGLGDVQVGAYYQVHAERPTSPGVTLNAHVSIPTGRAPYGIELARDASNTNLQFPRDLPTGSGVYGYQVGASFVKSSDPAIFFGGINYYLQSSAHFENLQFSPAGVLTPGTAQPGDAIQYQIGTAFALNDKTSLSFAFLQTVSNASRFHPDRGVETSAVGSATNAAALDISAGFASNARQTLITDLQIGLTQDAPNFQLGFRFPTRF
ncbi:MAG: hypothetical protein NVS2B3_06280 [Vulcanimicrobiaceae bacterium]